VIVAQVLLIDDDWAKFGRVRRVRSCIRGRLGQYP